MRNPARKAIYALTALLVGAWLFRFGALRIEEIGEHWTAVVPMVVGLAVLPFSLYTFIEGLLLARGRAKLLAGHRVIARWQVYPGEWEQFRSLDSRRLAERFSLGNDFWIRKAKPDGPIDVIVGETGLLIDDSYHVLRPGALPELRDIGWLEGPPTCLEFTVRYPRGRYGGTVTFTLRVPVPPAARGEARRVYAYFEPRLRRRPALALRNPKATFAVGWAVIALSLGAVGIGYGLSWTAPGTVDPHLAIGLMIGGVGFGVTFFLIILATALLSRR